MLKDRENAYHIRGGRPRGAKEHTQDHTAVTAESSPRSAWSQTPCSLCLPERHRTSSAHEFSALRQPLVLLISSSSHYQEVADVSYRATSGVTASRPEGLRILSLGCQELTQHRPGPAGLPGGLPAVSHFLSMSPITTGLLQEQVLKNQIWGKKKQVLMQPCLLDFSPSPPALYLSFLPVLFQLMLDILLHEGNCYRLGLPGS